MKFKYFLILAILIFSSNAYGKFLKSSYLRSKTNQDIVTKLIQKNYPQFVEELGSIIKNDKDQKFVNAVLSLAKDPSKKIKINEIDKSVSSLKPTQNEIDIDNSLSFPLQNLDIATSYLNCDNKKGLAPKNKRIITSSQGKYIIDGHHRWSQIFILNTNCSIKALDLPDIVEPINALKIAQIGMAVEKKEVKSEGGEKKNNLYTMEKKFFVEWVGAKINQEVLKVFINYLKQKQNIKDPKLVDVTEYLWKNVDLMRKNNHFIPNAPERILMPQTDGDTWLNNSFNVEAKLKN